MKNKLLQGSVFALLLSVWGCGSTPESSSETKDVVVEQKVEESCVYAFSKEKTALKWTAFKTTEKIGVSGEFAEYEVTNLTSESISAEGAVVGAKIIIPVNTTKTGDAGRDQRIVEAFFGTFTDTDTITAEVKSFLADGSGVIAITLNGITKDVAFAGEINDNVITTEAVLDLSEFDGDAAVQALNDACGDLHKGADGVTKLWPDVKLEITSELNKECK